MTAVAERKPKKKVEEPAVVEAAAVETPEVVPDPQPGDADYDWSAEYPGEKVFTYTGPNGATVGLAAISEKRQPGIGFLRKTRRKPDFEQILDMLEFIASDNALAVVDTWVPADLISMFDKWSAWNKTSAGE